MIIYRKKPFNCQMKNMLLLDAGLTDGCVYVSKDTYDQAISMMITYNNDKTRLEQIMNPSMPGWRNEPGLYDVFSKAFEKMPKPLNMLAIFLGYASESGINWKEEDPEIAAEQMYGALHMLSQFLDFNNTINVPAEVRTKIHVPKHIMVNYKESWDQLCSTLEDLVMPIEKDGDDIAIEKDSKYIQPKIIYIPMPMTADGIIQFPNPVQTGQFSPMPQIQQPAHNVVQAPTVTPVTPVAAAPMTVTATVEVESAEEEPDENTVSDDLMAKIQASINRAANAPINELKGGEKVVQADTTSTSAQVSSEATKQMTDEIRAEKAEVEESQKILNSYDI